MDEESTSGGSAQLAVLIDKYGEYLIPDVKQYYGIDLRDLFSEDDPMSPRWALMHITSLPVDSATVAEQRGGQQFRGWDEGRYMMATLINAIRISNYYFILANTDPEKSKPKPPDNYPLPDGNAKTKAKAKDKPGSFTFIAKARAAAVRKKREGRG